MRFNLRSTATALLTLLPGCGNAPDALCSPAATLSALPQQLDEASGIAFSALHDDVIWAHNDSEGSPLLYALDTDGGLAAEIDVSGVATQSDWEDIAVGPCPAGSCIYIGDIGDNLHDREDHAILRIAEPDPGAPDAGAVERFPIRYPDEPKDAEALFVLPDSSVYIISKGRRGSVTVYRYPGPLRPDETVTLESVQELTDGLVQLPDLVTGASATADGATVAVRTYSAIRLYTLQADTLAQVGDSIDLVPLGEPQGEGIAFARDGSIYLAGETGPTRQPTYVSRLDCRLP